MIKFLNFFKNFLLKIPSLKLLYIVFLILFSFSYAFSKNLNNSLLDQVEDTIKRPLPTIASILGKEFKDEGAPLIAIGYLENSNPPSSEDWGEAIGWFLMDAAYSTLQELTIVPPYQYNSDGLSVDKDGGFSRRDQLSRVASRVGARFGITGKIGIENNHFDIILELIDYKDNQKSIVKQYKGELTRIDDTVKDVSQTFLEKAIVSARSRKKLFLCPLLIPKLVN